MDFHRNVFYYYRAPVRRRSLIDRQLENNTTKALVNVLENCSPALKQAFLRWLGINTPSKVVSFELQKGTIGEHRIQRAKHKLLLGIIKQQSAQ